MTGAGNQVDGSESTVAFAAARSVFDFSTHTLAVGCAWYVPVKGCKVLPLRGVLLVTFRRGKNDGQFGVAGVVIVWRQGTSHVTRHTSHVTRHTSHVTRHASHVTRYTSHGTRHTSHVTRHALQETRVHGNVFGLTRVTCDM